LLRSARNDSFWPPVTEGLPRASFRKLIISIFTDIDWNKNSPPASLSNKENQAGEMTDKREKLLKNVLPLILLICILAFPAFSFAAGPKPDMVGKPQTIHDPQELQKSLDVLLRKAHAQYEVINGWHRRTQLEKARAQAKNHKGSPNALAASF
jgi:hypothetical protein